MKFGKFVISDSTKLVGKEPTLGFFGQFLFTKMNLSRFFLQTTSLKVCNLNISQRKNLFCLYLIFNYAQDLVGKKSNYNKH
jgi:hypothetical protein